MLDIYKLKKGKTYRIRQEFKDYYQNHFTPGQTLTFVERHFLPYDGGHTIVFRERSLYLQQEENAIILNQFDQFMEEVL